MGIFQGLVFLGGGLARLSWARSSPPAKRPTPGPSTPSTPTTPPRSPTPTWWRGLRSSWPWSRRSACVAAPIRPQEAPGKRRRSDVRGAGTCRPGRAPAADAARARARDGDRQAGLAAGGTAGALLGAELAGTDAAAGLPLGLLVVGQAAAAVLVSHRTSRVGRGRSLALGYVLGASGAALVVIAAASESLSAFLAGSVVLGAGNTSVFMTRFAAAEAGGEASRGQALGAVFFATALGAVASPGLLGPSGGLAQAVGLPPLAGLYVVALLCFVVAASLLWGTSNPATPYLGRVAALLGPPREAEVTRGEVALSFLGASSARAAVSILAAINLVMVAVMAVAPVHLVAHGHGLGVVGVVVGVHVAGMFMPSPLSGWAADRVGPTAIAGGGFLLMIASGAGDYSSTRATRFG